jgi:molybdopterin-binding protein
MQLVFNIGSKYVLQQRRQETPGPRIHPKPRGGEKYGAQNKIQAEVKSVKKGDIMSLVKFTVTKPHEMASVLTTESVKDLKLKTGDQVQLIIKAIHVLPVKE